jgi:N-acyl-D-amino-acid deacylase
LLAPGFFADIVMFDADKVEARATYTEPHTFATGVHSVFVNGVAVVRDGTHTGKFPGRVVYGPGKVKK